MEPLRTSDGSLTLDSERYAESYRSRHGALSEARHVFLEGSGVAAKLRSGLAVKVLEIGFGTGLNFLVTAQAAGPGTTLRYTALENDLPPLTALAALEYERLLAPSPHPAALLGWLRSLGEPPPSGRQRFTLSAADHQAGGVELDLVIGDALVYLPAAERFDAVYLDPFSPKVNPALWTVGFLGSLAATLAPGGRLVTYSVSGAVRRALQAAGLEVRKAAGPPGGKREMLLAHQAATLPAA